MATTQKKKSRLGPDGLPIMEVDRKPLMQGPAPAGMARDPGGDVLRQTPQYQDMLNRNPTAKPAVSDMLNRNPGAPAAVAPLAARPGAAYGSQNAPAAGSTTAIPAMERDRELSGLPAAPINDRRAQERARALKLRTLAPGGLDPAKEARIGQIYGAQDQVDAYARANRPVQRVQQPGEIANRHSELGRQLIGGFRTELEGIDQSLAALESQPLSEDKLRQRDVLTSQRAAKAAQLEKAMADPYWQQMPEQRPDGATGGRYASDVVAGQTRLSGRQMADRERGASEVAAFQGREQYARNLDDTMKQRAVAEELAASRAREAGSGAQTAQAQAITESGGLTPEQRAAVLEGKLRERELQAQLDAPPSAVTPANADKQKAQRLAAFSMVGIDTPEAYDAFLGRAMDGLRSLGGRKNSLTPDSDVGDTLASFNEATLPVLEQLEQLDPAAAAGVARDMLSVIPANTEQSPGSKIASGVLGAMSVAGGGSYGAFNASQQNASAGLTSIRQRLMRMAGVGG